MCNEPCECVGTCASVTCVHSVCSVMQELGEVLLGQGQLGNLGNMSL